MFNRKAIALACMMVMTGCGSIQPQPMAEWDLEEKSREDRAEAVKGVEALAVPLTLDEAMARALKYNLDRRVKLLEEAFANQQLDVSKLDMLPKVMANAGYTSRNNDVLRQSRNPVDGTVSPSQFISQDRSHMISDLSLTWSMLDFGVGYINAQQQADRLQIAVEKRRKAMHLLMQDVRIAYWRAASAEKLRDKIRETVRLAEDALNDSRTAEQARIRSPLDAMRYQRQVLENLRLLEAIDQELSAAHIDLALMINAPIGQRFKIMESPVMADRDALKAPIEVMEEIAMLHNPDALEQHYNARIAREEVRKTMLRLFPNISFSTGPRYDTDSYLLNNRWNETGLQISLNLVNLFTGPTQKKLAEAGVKLADQRRIATQMAVIAQVHVARQQFANALSQYERAEMIWQTDARISEQVSNRATLQVQSKLDRVSSDTASLLSELRRYQAMAQVYSAEARLQATLGIEPEIGSTDETSLTDLQKQIAAKTMISTAVQHRLAEQKKYREVMLSNQTAGQQVQMAEVELERTKAQYESGAQARKQSESTLVQARQEYEAQQAVVAQAERAWQDSQMTVAKWVEEEKSWLLKLEAAQARQNEAQGGVRLAQDGLATQNQALAQKKSAWAQAVEAHEAAVKAVDLAEDAHDQAQKSAKSAMRAAQRSQSELRDAEKQVAKHQQRTLGREADFLQAQSAVETLTQSRDQAEEDRKERINKDVMRAIDRQEDRQKSLDQARQELNQANEAMKLAIEQSTQLAQAAQQAGQIWAQRKAEWESSRAQRDVALAHRRQAERDLKLAQRQEDDAQDQVKTANRSLNRSIDPLQDSIDGLNKSREKLSLARAQSDAAQAKWKAEQEVAAQLIARLQAQEELSKQAEQGASQAMLAQEQASQTLAEKKRLAEEAKKLAQEWQKKIGKK